MAAPAGPDSVARMKSPRIASKPIDASFFASAPQRYVGVFDIPRTADSVWADLTTDNPLNWCRILKRITWTSPRPFGVGTTRTASALGGSLQIDERFFVWEEGRRQSFMCLAASLPLFRRMGEDYLVEPTGDAACRFTWTVAVEPPTLARPGAPVNAMLMNSLFKDTRKHYGLG